jgi:hypothetical protein
MVPISTLVEILGNILAPTTLLLGEMLVQRFVTEKTSDASAPSQGGPTQGPTLEEEMLQSLLMSSSIKNKDKGGGSGATTNPTSVDSAPPLGDKEGVHDEDMVLHSPKDPAVQCVISLTQTFQRHIKSLAKYPAFDKLWLRVLHVLGYFLDAPHGFNHSLLKPEVVNSAHPALKAQQQELVDAATEAQAALGLLLSAVEHENIFLKKEGLKEVTTATVRDFKAGADTFVKLINH